MTIPLLSIDELPAGRPLFIYGCGAAGRAFADILEHFLPDHEFAFLDSAKAGSLMGRPISRFFDLPGDALGNASIVIVSSYRAEIERNLATVPTGAVYDGLPLVTAWQHLNMLIRLKK